LPPGFLWNKFDFDFATTFGSQSEVLSLLLSLAIATAFFRFSSMLLVDQFCGLIMVSELH
jgi:hypothetical protein